MTRGAKISTKTMKSLLQVFVNVCPIIGQPMYDIDVYMKSILNYYNVGL